MTTTLHATQRNLLSDLRRIMPPEGLNTHRIAAALGHRQAYESHLRDRLFRLEAHGYVRHEDVQPDGAPWVSKRTWFLTDKQEPTNGR